MQRNVEKLEKRHIILLCNILVALFFVTVLVFKKGYSYLPMTLGIISTATLLHYYRKKVKLFDKEDKYLILALLIYFLTFLLSAIFNNDGFREIDNPSKILLLIPLIFFFKLYPIKKDTLLYSIPVGAFVTGVLAIYHIFFLKLIRPFPGMMSIQAGDISIVLSLFSFIITFYWFTQHRNKIAVLFLIFSIFGVIAGILSGARGGWLAFPFCFLLILIFNFKYINKKIIISIASLLTIALSIFIVKPEFGVYQRYKEGKADITAYLNQREKNSSLGARLDMWENALIAINQKPILGHGSKGYESFKKKQVESKIMAESTLQFNSLHNQYLEAFVKRGAFGFIALIATLIIPFIIFTRRLKTNDHKLKCIAILGIIHIISHAFFFLSQSFLAHNSGSLFYFFVLLVLYHLIKQKENNI